MKHQPENFFSAFDPQACLILLYNTALSLDRVDQSKFQTEK